jgi:hypothetical protein
MNFFVFPSNLINNFTSPIRKPIVVQIKYNLSLKTSLQYTCTLQLFTINLNWKLFTNDISKFQA